MWKEFKEFAIRGSAIDLAVGVVIGAAFGGVVSSLVNDILNPILSLLTGRVDFGGLRLNIFGHTMRYGLFFNALINFSIVSFAVFLLVKQISRFRLKFLPENKQCPHCLSTIPIKASKCRYCTSQLNP